MEMREPATSHVAVALGWVVIATLVVLLLTCFGQRRTSKWYVQVIVLLGWLGPFSIVYLLPIDISSTKFRKCVLDDCPLPFIYIPADLQKSLWQAIYWSLFGLTWFIIPLTQSYCTSGGFSFTQRAIRALKYNLWYYGVIGVVGLCFLAYFALISGMMDFYSIKALMMAISNAYGLLLVVTFMSYGLIEIPRFLWYSADIGYSLKALEFRASKIRENIEQAQLSVTAVVKEIASVAKKVPVHDPLRVYVEILLKNCPEAVNAFTTDRASANTITLKYLQELNKKFRKSTSYRASCQYIWEAVLGQAFYYQDVLENMDNTDRKFHSTLRPLSESRYKGTRQRAAWVWHIYIRSNLLRLLAVICGLLSVALVWSEVMLNVTQPALSIFGIIMDSQSLGYGPIELVCLLTIAYMCICTYSSLLKIKIFSLYQLVPNHHTDENSLLFFAAYLTRLTFPLCYNFLNLAQENEAVFSSVMGRVNLVPLLGNVFNDWVPVTLGVLCFITFFNIHKRFMKMCNMGSTFFVSDNDEDDVDIQDGRLLLQQARAEQERKLLPDGDGSYANLYATGDQTAPATGATSRLASFFNRGVDNKYRSLVSTTNKGTAQPGELIEIRTSSEEPQQQCTGTRSNMSPTSGGYQDNLFSLRNDTTSAAKNNLFVPLGRTSFTPRSTGTSNQPQITSLPAATINQLSTKQSPQSSIVKADKVIPSVENSIAKPTTWTLATGFTKKLTESFTVGNNNRPVGTANIDAATTNTDTSGRESQPVRSTPNSLPTLSNFVSFQRSSKHHRGLSLSSAAALTAPSSTDVKNDNTTTTASKPPTGRGVFTRDRATTSSPLSPPSASTSSEPTAFGKLSAISKSFVASDNSANKDANQTRHKKGASSVGGKMQGFFDDDD